MVIWYIAAFFGVCFLLCLYMASRAQPCSMPDCPVCNEEFMRWGPGELNVYDPSKIHRGIDTARPGSDRTVLYRQPGEMDNRAKGYEDMKAFLSQNPVQFVKTFMGVEIQPWQEKILGMLEEQGASTEYMNKVKQELCGPFGRVMP